MKYLSYFFTLLFAVFLSGCAVFSPPPESGTPEEAILERYGTPTAKYTDGDTVLWEYAGGYWSQQTYMARIGKDKRLISWEQVRTDKKFSTITVGKSNATDVLKTVGRPTETSQIHLNNYKVWSYRYQQDGVWDSMMHIMFDDNGIVQKMEIGRDPLYNDEGGFFRNRGFGIGIGGGRRGGGFGIGFGF